MHDTKPGNTVTLVLNCGSSSIKCACFKGQTCIAQGMVEKIGQIDAQLLWQQPTKQARPLPGANFETAITELLKALKGQPIIAVGHRVVHGGTHFKAPTRVTPSMLVELATLSPLAPLHNPPAILGIRMVAKLLPDACQVAVFDTSFHQSMPALAYRYAIPKAWYETHHVRRFGFHGINHQHIAEACAKTLQRPIDDLQIISAHLGNGGSVCAIRNGQSMDTSMGLTPLAGLVMGTRSGDIDPGLHAYLCDALQTDIQTLTQALNHESGLLGLSGLSHDMRDLCKAATQNPDAQLALDVYAYSLAKTSLGMLSAIDRLDALVFTGGIGENAANIRAACISHMQVLALKLDTNKNEEPKKHKGQIHASESRCPILVIPADEERMIATQVQRLLAQEKPHA